MCRLTNFINCKLEVLKISALVSCAQNIFNKSNSEITA